MFLLRLTVASALFLSFAVCAAQTAATKPAEPELVGVFYYLDSASQTLKRLPTEDFKSHIGTGWTTVTVNVRVAGEASSFHIAAGDSVAFVLKDEGASKTELHKFTVTDGRREYELGKRKGRDFTANPGLAINIVKYGEASYKVVPEAPLAAGEYALTMGPKVYTFSVTSAGK